MKRASDHAAGVGRMVREIPLATATVLAHRVPLLAKGFVDPSRRNPAEEQRMVAEKAAAGFEVSRRLFNGQTQMAVTWVKGAQALGRILLGQARGVTTLATPWDVAAKMLSVSGKATAIAVGTAAEAGAEGAYAGRRALAPVHGKVTANAKRLSRKWKSQA